MKHEESRIQKQIVIAVRLSYPKSIVAAIPNGAKRNVRQAVRLKAEGLLVGFSDLIFIHNKEVIFIEVKSDKGKQTDNQKEFQRLVELQGFKYWVVKSASETLDKIKQL